MLRYEEALQLILSAADSIGPLGIEEVGLAQAPGRVAASRIASAEALPPFDNSSMDGFAVVARETSAARRDCPVRLPVLGASAAGDAPAVPMRAWGAYEIMTGAPVPVGYDAVVKVEDVRKIDDNLIELEAPAEAGDFIRRAGQDFRAGMPVFDAGTLLDPRHVLALAALGVESVPVRRRPKVALISTGRELVEPGQKPGPGQIRNSTAAYLLAALPLLGAEACYFGTAPDDVEDFKRRMEAALATRPDVVVTTGAVSMGRHDFVTGAVAAMGAKTLFHKVAIRPGKPGLVARFADGPVFFGMPGNPVSTVVGLRFFLLPLLRKLQGMPAETPARMKLACDTPKPAGLKCFFKAVVSLSPEGARVQALSGQASFQIKPLVQANAWVIFPEEGDKALAGAECDVYPILPGPADWKVGSSVVTMSGHSSCC